MPRYQFRNPEGAYFITFAVKGRKPIFQVQELAEIFIKTINFTIVNSQLEVFAYCLMPDHVHMIIRSQSEVSPGRLLGRVKSFSAKSIFAYLEDSSSAWASRWVEDFKIAGIKNQRNRTFQIWEQYNSPKEITSNHMLDQKVHYIHMNPVSAGLVEGPLQYELSSARDYAGGLGLIRPLTLV